MRFYFLAILFFSSTLVAQSIESKLNFLSLKERERLEHLFSHFVQNNNLGFVLFGETKPACVCTIPLICDYAIVPPSLISSPLKYQRKVRQGWYVWNRYKHKFRHPSLIICEEYFYTKSSKFLNVFFLDKIKLLALLDEYKEDFEEVLGKDFLASRFINKLENRKKLRSLIKHDEKLLGLILGFGRQASTDFRDGKFEGQDLFSSTVGRRLDGCSITPVSFRGNPDNEESKFLESTYSAEALKIEKIFKSDTFSLNVFERLCSPISMLQKS